MFKNKKILISVIILLIITGLYFIVLPKYGNKIETIESYKAGKKNGSTILSLREAKSVEGYTKGANAIVIGIFTSMGDSEQSSDGTLIYTNLYFDVSEIIKDNSDNPINTDQLLNIKQYGGTVDGNSISMDDEITYVEGERDLLFLGTNEDNNYVVLGGTYGQYIIHSDDNVTDADNEVYNLTDLKNQILSYL